MGRSVRVGHGDGPPSGDARDRGSRTRNGPDDSAPTAQGVPPPAVRNVEMRTTPMTPSGKGELSAEGQSQAIKSSAHVGKVVELLWPFLSCG